MTTPGQGRNPAASHRAAKAPAGAKPKARCVLWCAPGANPEPELLDALHRRREVETEVVHSGYEAFALLCQRASHAKLSGDHAVLLLVDPVKLPGAVRVMESAAIYAAASSTWAFDRASPEKLRGVSIDDIAAIANPKPAPQAWPGAPAPSHAEVKATSVISGPRPLSEGDAGIVSSARVSIDPPQLRLTGGDPTPVVPETSETPPAPASHLLTDEELAMLLANEPDDDGQR